MVQRQRMGAGRWTGADVKSHGIEVRRGAGTCVEGTAVPTASVKAAFMAGASIDVIAETYTLPLFDVENAIRFECCRRSRLKAHAWARDLVRAGK